MPKNYLSKQKIPFTMVCNQIIFDVRISSKAKFYYVYLSSKPEGWEFYTNAIIKEIKEGKDAFYSGLQELEEFGYLERIQKRIDGKFGSTEYSLLIPDNLSYAEKSDTEKSDTEKPDYNNIYSNKKDITNKDCIALQGQSNFSKNEILTEIELEDFVRKHFEKATLYVQDATIGFVKNCLLKGRPHTKKNVLLAIEECIQRFPESYGLKVVERDLGTGVKIAQVETQASNNALSELSFEAFKDYWHFMLLRQAPSKGFEEEFGKFTEFWDKIHPNRKQSKYNNDWQNYLREWVKHDYNIKPKNESQPTQSVLQAPQVVTDNRISCVEIPINKPEIADLNKIMIDEIRQTGSVQDLNYNQYFKKCFIIDYDLKTNDKAIKVDVITNINKVIEAIQRDGKTNILEISIKKAFGRLLNIRDHAIELTLTIPKEGECKEINLIY